LEVIRSGKILYKKTDVTDWQQLDDLVEFTKEKLGSVDLMCNGAGVFEPVCFHTSCTLVSSS
jgi:NADP-dependent 3-hydroxy acid dehydrogenase YdfG